ncbi:MAG: hypothetical protein A3F68_00865 [Acidobacteria bacterium RIFCSPLOWO2_12_FULL_54_10]|nr:MAG: hypothetical protein A3F68_00865 [Acidobacteria bacterium RIFCSPLOWO2_12_FULL_54_10]
MAGTRHTHQVGHAVQIFTDDDFLAPDDDVCQAKAQLQQLLAPPGVARYIDNGEIYLAIRKKLFRLEAAASPRLGKKDDLISIGSHSYTSVILGGTTIASLFPPQFTVKPR